LSSDPQAGPESAAQSGIEQGTYELIRARLVGHGKTLADRANKLNAERLELFGGQDLVVVGNERVRTENNCEPRDVVSVGDMLLFGYNVFIGLKTETVVGDVFTLQRFAPKGEGFEFTEVPADDPRNFLNDSRFLADFAELYQYYKNARLRTLRQVAGWILAVFQVGDTLADAKVLRWSVDVEGGVTYVDNRGDRENVYPPSHDFEWTLTTREDHVRGDYPHVSILDEVFVETVGGDLTIKVEDNSATGAGIYSEPVEDKDQALDDAAIEYAKLGSLILLRVLPYREEVRRHLVFNTLTSKVARVDNIGQACVQLPEDHGIIFPGGYYLQRGETKTFDGDVTDMLFEQVIRSPNGEDVLYIFHRHHDGLSVLLPYNMIRKEVQNPIACHGFCIFEDGKMIVFKDGSGGAPTRVHAMQVWQTPYVSDTFAASRPTGDTFLEKIGNADLVRGISDALSLRRMIDDQSPSMAIYEELIGATVRAIDAYHWLGNAAVGDLLAPLKEVRQTAELIIDEFEKVETLRRQANTAVAAIEEELKALFAQVRPDYWKRIDDFVNALAELRKARGRLITTRDMRYVDTARLTQLEEEVVAKFDRVSEKSVDFLLDEKALQPYHEKIAALEAGIETVAKVSDMAALTEELDGIGNGLDLLTEVVGGLQIDDATVRTRILEGISEVMGSLNRTRALMLSRRKELMNKEGVAEFGAQFTLFSQSVQSALALADTPEKCDEQLSRLLLSLEDLEARFSEFDQFLEQLGTKREEVYEAFGSKKQMLSDQRQRRAQNMMRASERILTGIARRAATFQQADDMNAYFASDAMVMKVRDLAEKLRALGDSVKADEVESRLKSAREDAARGLRDKQDIFEEGASVIKLGKHRFSVNTQPLELSIVPRDSGMAIHLTGTGFYDEIRDEEFAATSDYWNQELVSETPEVCRAEYLAAILLDKWEAGQLDLQDGELLEAVRAEAAERYDEGYERGVHDVDAAAILEQLMALHATAGLLRFGPGPRAAGCLFWAFWTDADERPIVERKAQSLARLRNTLSNNSAIEAFKAELGERIGAFFEDAGLALDAVNARIAGQYLFEELAHSFLRFTTSGAADALVDGFRRHLVESGTSDAFDADLEALSADLKARYELARAWLSAWSDQEHVLDEAVVIVLTQGRLERDVSNAVTEIEVVDLLGQHRRIEGRKLTLRLDEFLGRLSWFRNERVAGYRAYQAARHALIDREKARLRLHEYLPRVMSAFVRNKLINDVYLPIFGDNLAKQLGALGAGKRTDLMGLLLLISPPGYGKTTLMEYIANRLGLVFMKVNGPALGHDVHSLDPAEAPNATARQEVNKINLALEMGNNVLLYLDDIQHTHPELLQKFISLCDAQRKIEGVWQGETRTYDLRGKKFVVCMAGNPYTESGDKFQIPDMLANRADVYNLGDILGGQDDTFALSYIENSLTSNPVLAQITTHEHADIYNLVRMAQGDSVPLAELAYGYSQVEVDEIVAVLKKMLVVQEVLLSVNQQYIASASMDESFRTEPPFKLQGSYRNMNKLAEKVVAVMNDQELEQLIDDHYLGEAQTLTTGAEWNLLKLREMRGVLDAEETERIAAIREVFQRHQMMGGKEDDPATRVTGQLGRMAERLESIEGSIAAAAKLSAAAQEATVAAQEASVAAQKAQTQAMVAGAKSAEAARVAEANRPAPDPMGPPLAALSDAIAKLADKSVQVQVVNSAPTGTSELLERQIALVESTLLPLVRSMGHAMRSDNALWDGISQVLEQLKSMDRAALAAPKKVTKTAKPFKKKTT